MTGSKVRGLARKQTLQARISLRTTLETSPQNRGWKDPAGAGGNMRRLGSRWEGWADGRQKRQWQRGWQVGRGTDRSGRTGKGTAEGCVGQRTEHGPERRPSKGGGGSEAARWATATATAPSTGRGTVPGAPAALLRPPAQEPRSPERVLAKPPPPAPPSQGLIEKVCLFFKQE